jgi:hypothetical protein
MTFNKEEYDKYFNTIDFSKYNRFNCPIYSPPLFPEKLSDYPVIICGNKDIALVAINRRKGFILHRDGAKTELSDVEELLVSQNGLIRGSCKWGREMIKEMQKKGQL